MREHKRQRSERFFTARQKVDGTVLLTRRLCENLYAGIENFLAPQYQLRLPAAEHGRKHLFQMAVNLFDSLQQPFAGFSDLFDGSHP